MSKSNFITTKDENTANQLKGAGYVLLSEDNGQWTFLNEGKNLNFSMKKAVFTNNICI